MLTSAESGRPCASCCLIQGAAGYVKRSTLLAGKTEGDFFRMAVKTPLRANYIAAGVDLSIETNLAAILEIAHDSFEQTLAPLGKKEGIFLRLWVDEESSSDERRTKAYFRGLGHLVFAGFDENNSLLINLRDRSAAGRFTPELANDAQFWRTILFPSLFTILGPTVGLTPLHCACVSWNGSGLLLAGESGSGKSTLSLALAQAGFDFLSDDQTLIGDRNGKILAWSLSPEMKHSAGAVAHFSALKEIDHHQIWKGEPVLRFDPVKTFGLRRAELCEPRWIIFLERQSEPAFTLEEIDPEEAVRRLKKDLHRQAFTTAEREWRAIDLLSRKECRTLRYGGDPHTVAGALRCLIEGGLNPPGVLASSVPDKLMKIETPLSDPLRRFRSTSLSFDAVLMRRRVRVETDSVVVLNHIARAFNRFEQTSNSLSPHFRWRIVCEPCDEAIRSWPPLTAFGDHRMRYINLGQRSFIAIDIAAREAVGILSECLAKDEVGFSSVFLASMFYLTAPALGLTPISAACVAKGEQGLLVFGPPNSGKTISSYSAKKLGLQFHADQAAFMELHRGTLRAWGDFWPAAFHPETAEFLPELPMTGQSFSYRDRTFLCLDKETSFQRSAESVVPSACIFLERQAPAPKLIPLSRHEISQRIGSISPFKDEAGSKEAREAVFQALGGLPWYRLLYGEDPSVAAVFFRSVLKSHHLMEHRL